MKHYKGFPMKQKYQCSPKISTLKDTTTDFVEQNGQSLIDQCDLSTELTLCDPNNNDLKIRPNDTGINASSSKAGDLQ